MECSNESGGCQVRDRYTGRTAGLRRLRRQAGALARRGARGAARSWRCCRNTCRWNWARCFDEADARRPACIAGGDCRRGHGRGWSCSRVLARERHMHVVAGSFLLDPGRGRYRNRSYTFAPDGSHVWQDKLRLTGFEKAAGVIEPGDELKVFEIAGVRAGSRSATTASSRCRCVRSAKPARACCWCPAAPTPRPAPPASRRLPGARAGEPLLRRQSVTAGEAPWSPALDVNTGEAALIAPMDVGLPQDGMIVQTRGDQHWAVADARFRRARSQPRAVRRWPTIATGPASTSRAWCERVSWPKRRSAPRRAVQFRGGGG